MELLDGSPAMDLYDERWPVLAATTCCPPARIADDGGRHRVTNSPISAGVVVGRSTVNRSVFSTGTRVADGCVLDEVVVPPGARIGAGCKLRRVIIDSNAEVPDASIVGYSSAGLRVELLTGDASLPKDFRSVA